MDRFGCYVPEPSSRSFINEFEDIETEEIQTPLRWTVEPTLPKVLSTLIIVEGLAMANVFKTSVLNQKSTLAGSSKDLGIQLYRLSDGQTYVCLFSKIDEEIFSQGQPIELMSEWFDFAELVIGFQSLNLATNYLTRNQKITASGIIRMLQRRNDSKKEKNVVPYLETPNMITGIAAAGISYREAKQKPWMLFAWYLESIKYLDGSVAAPLLKLLTNLKIPNKKFDQVVAMNHTHASLYL